VILTAIQRAQSFELARKAVIGVAAARLTEMEDDAALVITDFRDQCAAIGVDAPTGWAMLFSAAVVGLTDALVDLAQIHHQSPSAELVDFALAQEEL
jgi:hypothetical protein